MKYLTSRIALALIKLLPERRDKRRFLFFTLLASSTSILELGIAKVFSEIILGQDNQFNNFASLLFTFLLLSVVSKLAIYLQRTRRIEVFSDTHINEEGKSKTNTWNITLGIECSNIANHVIQVILIVVFISALSPAFGISTSLQLLVQRPGEGLGSRQMSVQTYIGVEYVKFDSTLICCSDIKCCIISAL